MIVSSLPVTELETKLTHAINCVSAENGSNTPDFILGKFLSTCLDAFNAASRAREKWYGAEMSIGSGGGLMWVPKNAPDPSERAIHIAARIWCDPEMANVVMDADACDTISKILDAVFASQDPQTSVPMTLRDLVVDP